MNQSSKAFRFWDWGSGSDFLVWGLGVEIIWGFGVEFWGLRFGFRGLGFGFWVWGLGSGFGVWALGLGFGVWGVWFGAWALLRSAAGCLVYRGSFGSPAGLGNRISGQSLSSFGAVSIS